MPDVDLSFLSRELPSDAGCAENRVLLGRYLTGGLAAGKDRRFREHVLRCEACRVVYRQALAAAARVGQGLRGVREPGSGAASRARSRPHRGAARMARWRLGLALAAAASLVLALPWGLRRRSVEIRCTAVGAGEVIVAGAALAPGDAFRGAGRGTWCTTRGDGRAELDGGGAELRVGPETTLTLEEAGDLRVRLLGGELEVDGSCTIDSLLGALRVRGQARVSLADGVLTADCTAGSLRFADHAESRALGAGERLVAELGRGLVSAP